MILGAASLDALKRIADRANDVLAAFTPGAVPARGDVVAKRVPLPSTDPLSVAAPPGSWFVTRDVDGLQRYTRAGSFHLGSDGTLRTVDDARALGMRGDGTLGGPLTVPEPDRILGRAGDVHLDSDGTLAYTRPAIDPRTRERTTERVAIGRIALARFPAGSNPQRIDATHFGAVAGVVPQVGAPAENGFGPLATSVRDSGTIDIDLGLQRLTDAYVAFSALQAAHQASRAGTKVVLDLVK